MVVREEGGNVGKERTEEQRNRGGKECVLLLLSV